MTLKFKSMMASSLLVVAWAVPAVAVAQNAFPNGSRIGIVEEYPTMSSVLAVRPTNTVGTSGPTVLGSDIALTFTNTGFTITSNSAITYGAVAFNGFRLYDIDSALANFTAVTLDANTITGLDSSRISFDVNNIYVNLQGLSFRPGLAATFNVSAATAGVPEPATWAMMIGGFGLVGAAMRRRKVAVLFA